jgi:hypothetical protein
VAYPYAKIAKRAAMPSFTNPAEINKLNIKLQFMKGGAQRSLDLASKCYMSCMELQQELRAKYDF